MGKEEKWVKAENITFLSECDDLDTGHLYSSEVHTLSIQTCTQAQTSGLERAEKREKKKCDGVEEVFCSKDLEIPS